MHYGCEGLALTIRHSVYSLCVHSTVVLISTPCWLDTWHWCTPDLVAWITIYGPTAIPLVLPSSTASLWTTLPFWYHLWTGFGTPLNVHSIPRVPFSGMEWGPLPLPTLVISGSTWGGAVSKQEYTKFLGGATKLYMLPRRDIVYMQWYTCTQFPLTACHAQQTRDMLYDPNLTTYLCTLNVCQKYQSHVTPTCTCRGNGSYK